MSDESSGDDFVNGNGSPVVSESDSDSSSEDDIITNSKRKLASSSTGDGGSSSANKQKKQKTFIEDEASDDDDDDEDEEDSGNSDEEGDNEYKKDGFVVDDDNDEEDDTTAGAAASTTRRKKKKKEKTLKRLTQRDELALDEEDIRLMQENLGLSLQQDAQDSDASSDEEQQQRAKLSKNDKLLTRQMFGDSDDEEDDVVHKVTLDNEEYDSDDMDEFIVDEDDNRGANAGRRRKQTSSTLVGPSAYQMDEAEELFGDVDFSLDSTTEQQPEPKKSDQLLNQYEPSVLSEHMMTDKDVSIRQADVPERYQALYHKRVLPTVEERSEEAEWICEFVFASTDPSPLLPDGSRGSRKRGELIGAIDSILKFFHQDKLEPVFVRRYCREFYKYAGLKGFHVAEIASLDEKWDKLDRKKKSLHRLLARGEDVQQSGGLVNDDDDEADSSVIGCLADSLYEMNIRAAADDNQIRDFAEFIALDDAITPDKPPTGGILRRPAKRGFYRTCRKAKLHLLTRKFTLPARTIGQLFLGAGGTADNQCPTPDEDPEMFALSFVRSEFPLAIDALKGARHIAACELAAEPNIRYKIRELYRQRAVIYTDATVKGKEDIDSFHYCHGFQYLYGQPVTELYKNEMFLRLARAEKEGYITMHFDYERREELLDPLKQLYCQQDDLWAEQRAQIVHDAVYAMLLPSLEKELRSELLQKAKQLVVRECGVEMKKRLNIRPYQSRDLADAVSVGVWVDDGRDSKVYLVKLDANGQMVDKLQALVEREESRIRALSNAVFSFLEQHADVHIVVLNTTAGMKCMDMGELIDGVRSRLQRNDVDRFGNMDGRDYLHVTFVQDDVARMYSRSTRAEVEFPDEPEGVKGAISLARYIQNPAMEISGMWEMKALDDPSRGAAILCLQVHPLQHFVGKAALLAEYDRVFSEVVNYVGVDINLAVHHRHASYQLQFVAGLGPSKATQLIAAIKRSTIYIERRDELLSNKLLGKTVFRNAAGFLRIRERDVLKDSALNPLDDTRIHPESYFMAVKMCGDANNKTALDLYDPDQYAYVVEDTMFQSASAIKAQASVDPSNPVRCTDNELQDPLSELDLPAYANRLAQDQKGLKLLTLETIKKELRYPFFEKRSVYKDPNDEDMLYLLHGETRETLRLGMIVPCTLQYETRDFVRVRLECGIRCDLRKELLPDYMDRDFLSAGKLEKGTTVHAKILRFEADHYGRYGVVIGCDDESLRNMTMCQEELQMRIPSCSNFQKITDDCNFQISKLLNRPPLSAEEVNKSRFSFKSKHRKRPISHTHFHNVDCRGALNLLKDQPAGEALFRPSSLGTDHLTLSWKQADKVYRHYDIQEKEKETERRLGAKLVLKNETYEDLDEILARYIGPMNDLVEDLMQNPKFNAKSRNDIFKELHEMKEKNPKSFPYCMRFSAEHPGCVAITYITNKTARNVYAQFGPNGLTFYGKFSSRPISKVGDFLNFFKKAVTKLMKNGDKPAPRADRQERSRRPADTSSRMGKYGRY